MHICTVVQKAVLGWCLPTNIAPHSRSHAAFVEVSYWVSWLTKGFWQPIWCASSGTSFGDELHQVLSVRRRQICMAIFKTYFRHIRHATFMWQPDLLQVAKFLDAGM